MFNSMGRSPTRHNETDPRRRPRHRSDRDRHSATMMVAMPVIATVLAHIGLQLRVLRERLTGR